jgi:cell division protein YceG involved in septum cleavage
MSKTGYTVTAVLALLAFILGFAAINTGLDLSQPIDPDNLSVVQFAVHPGDATGDIATHLQDAGLIRSAILFRMVAGSRHLDKHVRPGTYQLSPYMTIDAIIQQLNTAEPSALPVDVPLGKVLLDVPPGARMAQIPDFAGNLPAFHADKFLTIATSGALPDGKKLTDSYWFLRAKQPHTVAALEGYLLPGHYFLDPQADEVAVVNALLTAVGEQLCPGPDVNHLDAYVHDAVQCKAHAATAGPKRASIFTEMEQRFGTTDDVVALYDTLTVASLVVRLTPNDVDAPGVAAVYMNRLQAAHTHKPSPSGDFVENLDAPSTAQYARDSLATPPVVRWWAPLAGPAGTVAVASPYNSAVPGHNGLIPGPIAAPTWADVQAVAAANETAPSPNYFVTADRCGHAHFATSLASFLYTQQKARLGCFSD